MTSEANGKPFEHKSRQIIEHKSRKISENHSSQPFEHKSKHHISQPPTRNFPYTKSTAWIDRIDFFQVNLPERFEINRPGPELMTPTEISKPATMLWVQYNLSPLMDILSYTSGLILDFLCSDSLKNAPPKCSYAVLFTSIRRVNPAYSNSSARTIPV